MNNFSFFGSQLLALNYLLFGISYQVNFIEASKYTPKCGAAFLTVSSDGKKEIELNWVNDGCTDEVVQEVRLHTSRYTHDYESGLLLTINARENLGGYKLSGYYLEDSFWPYDWKIDNQNYNISSDRKLTYYIETWGDYGNMLDLQHLRYEPTWMADNSDVLAPLRLGELAIPGTHDSACYKGSGVYHNYIYAQDYSIWEQLVLGIRCLDLRVAYYESGETFYINHDSVYVRNLDSVYSQIWNFVQRAPKEVIILDFHRFTIPSEWSDELHRKFIKYTINFFKSYIVLKNSADPHVKGRTLEEIWNTNQRIVLTYGEYKYVELFAQLWPPVRQGTAKTIDTWELKTILKLFLESNENNKVPFNTIIAELTPRAVDVVFAKNNLRTLAAKANSEVTRWVRDDWRDLVNIVATDYFLGNNIIQIAIDINKNRKPNMFNGK